MVGVTLTVPKRKYEAVLKSKSVNADFPSQKNLFKEIAFLYNQASGNQYQTQLINTLHWTVIFGFTYS